MLSILLREPQRLVLHRLAGRRSVHRTAEKLGLSGADLDDFVSAIEDETLAKILLSDPFDQKVFNDMPPYGWPTRFSDGTFPVFYAAETRETTEWEMRYHRERAAKADPEQRFPIYMWAFQCEFSGNSIDLRQKRGEWEWLTSDETCDPSCLKLGQEAIASADVDAFQAPSARHSEGTTVPTFNDKSLSNAAINGTTIFTYIVETESISLTHV